MSPVHQFETPYVTTGVDFPGYRITPEMLAARAASANNANNANNTTNLQANSPQPPQIAAGDPQLVSAQTVCTECAECAECAKQLNDEGGK